MTYRVKKPIKRKRKKDSLKLNGDNRKQEKLE